MKADVRLIRTTFFRNKSAATLTARDMSLEELRELILGTSADIKDDLPWLKLAAFGDKRSDKGSLRHDTNVVSISGIEGRRGDAVRRGDKDRRGSTAECTALHVAVAHRGKAALARPMPDVA
jgi:hypothetical protein